MGLVAILVSGCGGGSSGSSGSEQALTKQQFIRRAHAICYRLSKKQVRQTEAFYKAHGLNAGEPSQRAQERSIVAVVLPVVEEKVEELGALPVPAGDKAKVRAILTAMERGVSETKAHPEWLAAATSKHPNPFAESEQLVAAYGVWLCAQP
ncbi:MAG: hypothetical protein ACTHNP_05630 [Solirubrobacterales bacterium]